MKKVNKIINMLIYSWIGGGLKSQSKKKKIQSKSTYIFKCSLCVSVVYKSNRILLLPPLYCHPVSLFGDNKLKASLIPLSLSYNQRTIYTHMYSIALELDNGIELCLPCLKCQKGILYSLPELFSDEDLMWIPKEISETCLYTTD